MSMNCPLIQMPVLAALLVICLLFEIGVAEDVANIELAVKIDDWHDAASADY